MAGDDDDAGDDAMDMDMDMGDEEEGEEEEEMEAVEVQETEETDEVVREYAEKAPPQLLKKATDRRSHGKNDMGGKAVDQLAKKAAAQIAHVTWAAQPKPI